MSYTSYEYQLRRMRPVNTDYSQRYSQGQGADAAASSSTARTGKVDRQDLLAQDNNWTANVELANSGVDKVADFVINKIPSYRQKILTAMNNDDRDLVETIRGEMTGFIDKHRDELQAWWAGLRDSGEKGRAVSSSLESLLDGSYVDKWMTRQTVNGRGEVTGGTTMRAFMEDRSPEATVSAASLISKTSGIDIDTVKSMVDPSNPWFKVFSPDKNVLDGYIMAGGRALNSEDYRMFTQWVRTKHDIVNRKATAFTSADEAAEFFSAWESNFSRTKNGGQGIIENAIDAFKSQRVTDGGLGANAFVERYADLVNGIVESKVVTGTNGQTHRIEASSYDRMKALGLANATFTVGRKLGLDANVIFARPEIGDMLADQLREIKALGDNGFDIYSVSKSPNEDAAETVMARLGVPGATDRFKYYADARRNLDSAVLSDNDVGLASIPDTARGRDGKPVSVENAFLHPIEMPVRDALARSISGFREGDEGWGATVERVLGDGEKRKAVKADVLKSLSGIKAEPEVKDAIAEAYIGNLTAEKRVSAVDVLRGLAGMTVDAKGEATTTKAQELQADQLRLGQTVTVTNPETHLSGTPGAGQVTADRSQTRTLTASGDTRFQAALRANPNLVMPRLDGDPSNLPDKFRAVGDALAFHGDDHDRRVDSAALDLLSSLTGGPRLDGVLFTKDREIAPQKAIDVAGVMSSVGIDPKADVSADDVEIVLQLAAVAHNRGVWDNLRQVKVTFGRPDGSTWSMSASSALRRILTNYGFFSKDGTYSRPGDGFSVSAGLGYLRQKIGAKLESSPTFNLLYNGDGVSEHANVDRLLVQQQKQRLASSFIAKDSAPAGETPVQKSARNLLQVYDRDSQNVRANNELWVYCLRESGNKPEAAAQMFNSYADYYAQERIRGGKASADSWMKDITSRHWRYLPVVDKGTGTIVQGMYQRSVSPMTDQEFKDYCLQCNATLIRDQVPLQIDQVTFDKFDSEGSVRWFEMQDEGRKATARKMEYDYRLAYDLAKEGGGE